MVIDDDGDDDGDHHEIFAFMIALLRALNLIYTNFTRAS